MTRRCHPIIAYPDHKDISLLSVRKLAAAILEIAVNDICGYYTGSNGDEYKDKAKWTQHYIERGLRWINDNTPADRACSFLWCCDVCGLDAEAVRDSLNSGRSQRIQRRIRSGKNNRKWA